VLTALKTFFSNFFSFVLHATSNAPRWGRVVLSDVLSELENAEHSELLKILGASSCGHVGIKPRAGQTKHSER
jgi:hypothetical protein